MEEFDYVIVGAGAAGCVLANRLTESGKNTVALIEAGGKDSNIWIKVPAGFNKTVYNDKLNWGYETAPGPHIDDRRIKFPRGKVLGGSGSINGHLYVRGQAADYDMWAQLGCRGWSWSDVLPYFKRAETRIGGSDEVRGRSGPLRIEDQSEPHVLSDAYMAANEALGLKRTPDYNGGDQEGTLLYQQMMRGGRRWSPVDAYLRPILGRANLKLITHALAERVDLEGKRAVGVTYRQNRQTVSIKARRDVILSGGAINTPQLLQISGIGDPAWLADIGVETKHALPGVGRNLRDHYAIRISALVKGAGSLNERSHGLRLVGEVVRYAITRKGLLATSPSHAGGYLKTRPGLETPDMQLYFAPASYGGGGYGTTALDTVPGMTLGAAQLRPESKGHVKALAADPDRQARDPAQLPRGAERSRCPAGGNEIPAQAFGHATAGRPCDPRELPRPRRADRRAVDGPCPRHRLDDLSSGRHLQARHRPDGRGRSAEHAGDRPRRPARRRRLVHADDGVGQHLRRDQHDRRERHRT